MKTKIFYYEEDGIWWIGIGVPLSLIQEKMSDSFLAGDKAAKNIPLGHLCNLAEGQTTILKFMDDGNDGLKYAALPVEEYVDMLGKDVLPAIRSALYVYEKDTDRTKFIQQTQTLFAFVLGYIEAYANTDKEVGSKNLRDKIATIFEMLDAYLINIDCSSGFFSTSDLCKRYVSTWYVEHAE